MRSAFAFTSRQKLANRDVTGMFDTDLNDTMSL